MILFKGAGPGTHWALNDARLTGFVAQGGQPHAVGTVMNHVRGRSHPSPYLSTSTSYAVARTYAEDGPGGPASATNPGYVYEVDTSLATVQIVDPLRAVVMGSANGPVHAHDGGQDLILGIARPMLHGSVLAKPPARLGNLVHAPTISPQLHCVVFVIRDGEVLIRGTIPTACITARHSIP